MYLRVGRHVGVSQGVGSEGRGVGVAPDAAARGGLAAGVGAHRPRVGAVGELGGSPVGGEHQGEVVAPAFAALLSIAEAATVGRAAGEAVRNAVAVLVHHHAVVEVAVELRAGCGGLRQGHLYAIGNLAGQYHAVGLRHHHGRNGYGVVTAAHYDGIAGHIIDHNNGNGPG